MSVQETVEAFTRAAIKMGREDYNQSLDWSDESIKKVEEILDSYHESYLQGEQSIKEQVKTLSHIWGVYTGEVLRRNQKSEYTWQESEFGLVLMKNEKNFVNPVAKAYKHIVKGRESGDSIKAFFDVSILIMQGKFPV